MPLQVVHEESNFWRLTEVTSNIQTPVNLPVEARSVASVVES